MLQCQLSSLSSLMQAVILVMCYLVLLAPTLRTLHEAAAKRTGTGTDTDTDTDTAATATFVDFEREIQDWMPSDGREKASSRDRTRFASHLSEK